MLGLRAQRVFVVEEHGGDDDDVAGDEGRGEDGVLGAVRVEQGQPHGRHGGDEPRHRPQQLHDGADHQALQTPVQQHAQPQGRGVHRPATRPGRVHHHVSTTHKHKHNIYNQFYTIFLSC